MVFSELFYPTITRIWYTFYQAMKKIFPACMKLLRLKTSLAVTLFASLLGVAASQATPNWKMLCIILANIFSSWILFLFRDWQYAPQDISKQADDMQNPIAAGIIKLNTAKLLLLVLVGITITLYAIPDTKTLITGLALLAIIFILNWRKLGLQKIFHLKTSPYNWLVNAFFCLLGSLGLADELNQFSMLAIAFVVLIMLYISLIDQARQGKSARTLRRLNIISAICLSLAGIIGIMLFVIFELLPYWVTGLSLILMAIMVVPQTLERFRAKEKPLFENDLLRVAFFRSGALGLMVHFLVPLIYSLFIK